ncbi:MAG: hypothetical protein Q8M95_08070 [Candidatus Methanoperedens sp.]|nr:hypothetical protein [Candidatus Methanoperedens sp.]
MEQLEKLAKLIRDKNKIETEIAGIIGRPSLIGHVGEYIASHIFSIELEKSANNKSIDGQFTEGSLSGKTVNIKWYGKQEGILDITPDNLPDFYLVLTGPKSAAVSSRGTTRPWTINSVFLFDANELVTKLKENKVKIGVATSVRSKKWEDAMVYPIQHNSKLALSDGQKGLLQLFSEKKTITLL